MGVVWSNATVPEGRIENVPEDNENRQKSRQEEMDKFKDELRIKREARHEAILALNTRINNLTEENERLKQENIQLKLKNEPIDSSDQREELEGLERQIKALKDVAVIGSNMLKIREQQVNELKAKLESIEETGLQYEKEVENMRKLRDLYEERSRAITISHQMELERERARIVASETRKDIAEQNASIIEEKNKELEERVASLDASLDAARAEISELKVQLAGKSEDLFNIKSEMDIVNQLFGQVLSPGDNIEKVTRVLEEHHDLVNHLTESGKINDLASTLLNLAHKEYPHEQEDITTHLNKVWKLLVELLGHHVKQVSETPDSCYKSVETPSGPKLVISVSQTFLRLKDLILEKNSLVKEVGRLKDLNTTLEDRLIEQENRLVVVASELHTTWGVVNKLKTQHKQLHTHEKVLRYELAQKRNMLKDLRRELEECKENWTLARAKNTKTEEDWKILRTEFALRKQQISSPESGYEESPTDSQDEEEHKDDPCKILAWDHNSEAKPILDFTKEEIKENPQEFFTQIDTDACKILAWDDQPHCSQQNPTTTTTTTTKTTEEILDARQARLKRLEEQCQGLFNKMSETSQRSDLISNRLVELHEHYGEEKKNDSNETEPDTDDSKT